MELLINGCEDCPMLNIEWDDTRGYGYGCNHPDGSVLIIDIEKSTPTNCPLKQNPITITIKQDNQ